MHPLTKGRKELKKSESVRKSECYIFSEVQFSISAKVFVILLTTVYMDHKVLVYGSLFPDKRNFILD